MSLFNIFSCTEDKNIYIYNTPSFKEKEKQLEFSLEEAAQIYANYLFEKEPQKNKVECIVDIIYGDDYVFVNSSFHYNAKTGYNISGIWIDGNTGEVKEKKETKYIKVPDNSRNTYIIISFHKQIERIK